MPARIPIFRRTVMVNGKPVRQIAVADDYKWRIPPIPGNPPVDVLRKFLSSRWITTKELAILLGCPHSSLFMYVRAQLKKDTERRRTNIPTTTFRVGKMYPHTIYVRRQACYSFIILACLRANWSLDRIRKTFRIPYLERRINMAAQRAIAREALAIREGIIKQKYFYSPVFKIPQ